MPLAPLGRPMRSVLAGLFLLFASLPAFAAGDAVVVLQLSVSVGGATETILGANVPREWLLSWAQSRDERRDVTLIPLTNDGRPLPQRTIRGCTLSEFSGLDASNTANVLRLSCHPGGGQ